MHRLIRHANVESISVGVGIHGHGSDAHAPSRFDDPAGDLATVGDEDFSDAKRASHWMLSICPKGRLKTATQEEQRRREQL